MLAFLSKMHAGNKPADVGLHEDYVDVQKTASIASYLPCIRPSSTLRVKTVCGCQASLGVRRQKPGSHFCIETSR